MLHNQHIRIDTGRAIGGDFMCIIHLPSGISRRAGPPLGTGKEAHETKNRMLREIEEELISKGLTEFIWHPEDKARNR
jgi:hypothetical protein